MSEEEQTQLYWESLAGDADAGILTDWPGTGFNHVVSMKCCMKCCINDARWMLPAWDVQLAAILQFKGVFLED